MGIGLGLVSPCGGKPVRADSMVFVRFESTA
jgi:hypothetical protein